MSLCHRNIIYSSPEFYGYFRNLWQCSKMFGNVRKRLSGLSTFFGESSEILRKSSEIYGKPSKNSSLVCLYNIKKRILRNSCLGYGISLLVFNLIFYSFTALTREMSNLTLEEKIYIHAQPCIIVYPSKVIFNDYLFHTVFHLKSCEQPQSKPFVRQSKFCLNF